MPGPDDGDRPEFEKSKQYQDQEDVFFDDGREIELLHYVYGREDVDELRGNPERVLKAVDDYARTKKYLMNVGEDKGKIVTNLIREVKPQTMVSGFISERRKIERDSMLP
ncbi:MAG: hypothetical protein INR71_00190 [Terriglobus roseus]|nr:hypothetical protein [Terriglobus roseus]